MRINTLEKAMRAANTICENLASCDWVTEAGWAASRALEDYVADIATDIFETWKGPITDEEREYIVANV